MAGCHCLPPLCTLIHPGFVGCYTAQAMELGAPWASRASSEGKDSGLAKDSEFQDLVRSTVGLARRVGSLGREYGQPRPERDLKSPAYLHLERGRQSTVPVRAGSSVCWLNSALVVPSPSPWVPTACLLSLPSTNTVPRTWPCKVPARQLPLGPGLQASPDLVLTSQPSCRSLSRLRILCRFLSCGDSFLGSGWTDSSSPAIPADLLRDCPNCFSSSRT